MGVIHSGAMTDYIASLIRTYVPVAVGGALFWLSQTLGVTEIDTTEAKATATAICIAVFYGLVRKAEQRWPQVGWLLGLAKKPNYPAA